MARIGYGFHGENMWDEGFRECHGAFEGNYLVILGDDDEGGNIDRRRPSPGISIMSDTGLKMIVVCLTCPPQP